ncbi:TPA: hypothetical protein DCQ44_02415 [Candidatus Taylorbacteria bacterium]|nr:hypothetical protein [Candidatus Taylorbacteria bacterium]
MASSLLVTIIAIVSLARFYGYSMLETILSIGLVLVVLALMAGIFILLMRNIYVPLLVKKGKIFTSPKPQAIKAITYGPEGKFVRWIVDPTELVINNDGKILHEDVQENGKTVTKPVAGTAKEKKPSEILFDAEFIGLLQYQVYTWEMQWSRPRKADEQAKTGTHEILKGMAGDEDIVHRREQVDYLKYRHFLSDRWVTRFGGNDPSNVINQISFTALIQDPQKAIFGLSGGWYPAVYAVINQELEKFMASTGATNKNWKSGIPKDPAKPDGETRNTMVALKEAFEKEEFLQAVLKASGTTVLDFAFTSTDPQSPALEAANQKAATAEQDAVTKLIGATASKKARVIEGEGEKEYLELIADGNYAVDTAAMHAVDPENKNKDVRKVKIDAGKFANLKNLRVLGTDNILVNAGNLDSDDVPAKVTPPTAPQQQPAQQQAQGRTQRPYGRPKAQRPKQT